MGELIELAPYLRLRSSAARGAGPVPPSPVHCALPPAREGVCESCSRRDAVAEVFRSDAVEAGLGGRLQCARCLAGELRRKRCGPDARHAERMLALRLRGALRTIRVDLDWDVRQERAVALDGEPLQ